MKVLCTDCSINETLIRSDPKLKAIIDCCGHIEVHLAEDYFSSLASSIIGQQLSSRAADVIRCRVVNLLDGSLNPKKVLSIKDEEFRRCGVSYSKIRYIKNLSEFVNNLLLTVRWGESHCRKIHISRA